MIKRWTTLAAAGLLAVALGGPAFGQGLYTNGLPTAGGTQYPLTLPLTGAETIPADTNLTQGRNPATEAITALALSGYTGTTTARGGFRNFLLCGDFSTCPWQRGTTVSSDIANTLTYYADGWWNLGGASSAINVTKITTSQQAGFGGSLRFQRKSANADTTAICMGQVLESADSYAMQGQTVELSFWAKLGATYSGASSVGTWTIGTGTGVDGSAANFAAGTWTGYAAAVATNFTMSTTWTRYSTVVAIPSTAVQVGVKFCYTPVGTAGATDSVEFAGIQLAINPAAVANTGTGLVAYNTLAFERKPISYETALAHRYYYRITETNGGQYAQGMVSAANVERANLQLPETMRAVPTCTFTAGGLKWDLEGTDTGVGTLTCSAASTPSIVTIGDTVNSTAGFTAALLGSNTTGIIQITAEL
jgi:hypothetical protein